MTACVAACPLMYFCLREQMKNDQARYEQERRAELARRYGWTATVTYPRAEVLYDCEDPRYKYADGTRLSVIEEEDEGFDECSDEGMEVD